MQEIMKVVVEAALRGGCIIASHFYQPGGPQGAHGHCVADEEAERAIRQYLEQHLPLDNFSIVGEELGEMNRYVADSEYLVLVDPGDGTSAFLKGFRGSAVSIGLLRNGDPVLGVVYSPTARAGYGDLITWYEGGPLTRNGISIATSLPATGVIAVSQHGDKASVANQRLCGGEYRFLSVASIAYRLALTAVGELDAGLSLAGPVAWDVAAGTALLRARGGVVMGKSASYDDPQIIQHHPKTGEIQPTWGLMGGSSPQTVYTLLSQPWEKIYEHQEAGADWDLCWPDPRAIVGDPRLLNAGQGLLMGLLAGDALGSAVEFRHRDAIVGVDLENLRDGGVWNLMAGQITDDSELAMMLARSLLKAGTYKAEMALEAYVAWFQSDPFDIGNTTRRTLSVAASTTGVDRLQRTRTAAKATGSQSNGALMRVAPLALWGFRDLDILAEAARIDAELTHAHPACVGANQVLVITLAFLLRGETPEEAYAQTLRWAHSAQIHQSILTVMREAEHALPVDTYTHQGWVLISLQIAYHQLLHATDLGNGLREVVRLGGDTDTNAAITGALLGARFGVNAIPGQWMRMILSARPIKELSSTAHPRPRAFWPVDALFLAERTVAMGVGLE